MSDNTKKKQNWAVRLFKGWHLHRNQLAKSSPHVTAVEASLETMTVDELNYNLTRFLMEIRKEKDGSDYPPNTLHEIITSIQLHFHLLGKNYRFLLQEQFAPIRNTLDNLMQSRARQGLGSIKNKADIITLEEENLMWSKGVLGFDDPDVLVSTIVYLFGLNFALRAGQEHRNLRFTPNPQVVLHTDKDGRKFLRYTEDFSKCNRGGLKHRRTPRKIVDAYENPNKDRCVVRCYEIYCSHVPVPRPEIGFYLKPRKKWDTDIWYSQQALGRSTLSGVVKNLCEKVGLTGNRTNHSLRATSATRMFDQNVDEQNIAEITGHKSDAVREYKRTSDAKKRFLSRVIQGSDEVVSPKRIALSESSKSLPGVPSAASGGPTAIGSASDASSDSSTVFGGPSHACGVSGVSGQNSTGSVNDAMLCSQFQQEQSTCDGKCFQAKNVAQSQSPTVNVSNGNAGQASNILNSLSGVKDSGRFTINFNLNFS